MLPSTSLYPEKPVDLHAMGDGEYQAYAARVGAILGLTPSEIHQSVAEATADRSDYGKLTALYNVYMNATVDPEAHGLTHAELGRRKDMLAGIPDAELVNCTAHWTESGELYLADSFDISQRTPLLQRDPDASIFSFNAKAQEELDNIPPLAKVQIKAHLEAAAERLAAGDYSGCTNQMLRARYVAYRYSAMNLLGELDNRVEELSDHANATHEASYASRHLPGEREQDGDEGMAASYTANRVADYVRRYPPEEYLRREAEAAARVALAYDTYDDPDDLIALTYSGSAEREVARLTAVHGGEFGFTSDDGGAFGLSASGRASGRASGHGSGGPDEILRRSGHVLTGKGGTRTKPSGTTKPHRPGRGHIRSCPPDCSRDHNQPRSGNVVHPEVEAVIARHEGLGMFGRGADIDRSGGNRSYEPGQLATQSGARRY